MISASMSRPSAFQVWLAAARPATLPAALSPVMVGTALAASSGQMRLDRALAALLGALLIQIATNFYNDYADFQKGADTEERLGPPRATQKGWLLPSQVLWAAFLTFGLATAVGVYLVAVAGWPVVFIGLLSIACGILYTGGPMPLAYHGLGDLFVMIFFGAVAVCGTYYVQALSWSFPVFWASLAVGALITAILVVNNLRDYQTDEKAGKITLVVRYGTTFGHFEYGALMVWAYGTPFFLCALAPDFYSLYCLLPLVSAPMALAACRRVWTGEGVALNPELGATAKVGLIYSLLFSIGVVL